MRFLARGQSSGRSPRRGWCWPLSVRFSSTVISVFRNARITCFSPLAMGSAVSKKPIDLMLSCDINECEFFVSCNKILSTVAMRFASEVRPPSYSEHDRAKKSNCSRKWACKSCFDCAIRAMEFVWGLTTKVTGAGARQGGGHKQGPLKCRRHDPWLRPR